MTQGESARTEGGETARRALRLIEAVVTAGDPIGLDDLATQVGLSKSTCYRLLRVLQDELYVERVDAGGYRVGNRLIAVSSAVLADAALYQAARPALRALSDASGETATLHLRAGNRNILVLGVESADQVLRRAATVGETTGLGSGSSGRSILAFLPAAEAEPIIMAADDPQALRRSLDEIRRDGYALSYGANHPGVHGIAAPVLSTFDVVGQPMSVALSGPADRWTGARMASFADKLITTCAHLSELFDTGWRSNP
ncbi:IclR family transcriptional regulator [Kutzneria buriramensis]|uniref:IclR family acetate operon transcriptional repressor n=1 Tax=Kutzneria buriramensis TaxID=1045776 RepID=A0A3E0I6W4_9PSEU|nr:IclR family transcriptional regulator C-terminal domain-containing protein [Kutzneria buriramensis]REH54276.1 IclR family acetate operon transcriptional repressor [Kutzneria buriramensis]